ncbi:aldehyde dehydrogenase family protein [Amycolatopsis sp.]|uniref:aldehyde dehydrogenase family protein n=1 Tax=Amycolatopsis sp. TaxID=37632 RepID=UPI00261139A1|nr:aldehyde dehydrogenase family protein [Amycolatopsis sp.]
MSLDKLRELLARHAVPDSATAIDGVRICEYDHDVSPRTTACTPTSTRRTPREPIASRLEAGRVAINGGYDRVSPFGGFKQSGIGREYGAYGLEGVSNRAR